MGSVHSSHSLVKKSRSFFVVVVEDVVIYHKLTEVKENFHLPTEEKFPFNYYYNLIYIGL